MIARIFVTGRVEIEAAERLVAAGRFPGRQGRRAFVYLVCERDRPVPREELADAVWSDALPPAWDAALNALVSKLRRLLSEVDPTGGLTITSEYGAYTLRAPADSWVDYEAAVQAVDDAEGALRRGEAAAAWGAAGVAAVIARRPFLPAEEGAWIEQRRTRLRSLLVRSLDCLSESSLAVGSSSLAVEVAAESVRLEPFRETGYQRLMRAHAALGNRAEALRVYEQCRRLLAEELGTDPSSETAALYLKLLQA